MIIVFGKVNFHMSIYKTPIINKQTNKKIYIYTHTHHKMQEYLRILNFKPGGKETSYKNNIVLKILPITVKQEKIWIINVKVRDNL